jgi:hypothetical protein
MNAMGGVRACARRSTASVRPSFPSRGPFARTTALLNAPGALLGFSLQPQERAKRHSVCALPAVDSLSDAMEAVVAGFATTSIVLFLEIGAPIRAAEVAKELDR